MIVGVGDECINVVFIMSNERVDVGLVEEASALSLWEDEVRE